MTVESCNTYSAPFHTAVVSSIIENQCLLNICHETSSREACRLGRPPAVSDWALAGAYVQHLFGSGKHRSKVLRSTSMRRSWGYHDVRPSSNRSMRCPHTINRVCDLGMPSQLRRDKIASAPVTLLPRFVPEFVAQLGPRTPHRWQRAPSPSLPTRHGTTLGRVLLWGPLGPALGSDRAIPTPQGLKLSDPTEIATHTHTLALQPRFKHEIANHIVPQLQHDCYMPISSSTSSGTTFYLLQLGRLTAH